MKRALDVDRAALESCVKIARRDRERRKLIDDKLASGETWDSVAFSACYGVQFAALRLKPWESPPCVVDEDGFERDPIAQTILRQMLGAGVSRYDPDPLKALARARAL